MIVTVTLAHGAMRMAREQVIVKRLSAIHDLGSMDVLCSDKTGTLTEARIRLVREVDLDGQDSQQVLRLAHLNAAFETGLQESARRGDPGAIGADARGLEQDRRGSLRLRAPPGLGAARGEGRRLLIVVKGAPEDVLTLHDVRRAEKRAAAVAR